MESRTVREAIIEKTIDERKMGRHYVVRRYRETRSPEQVIRALIEAHMC